MVLWSTVAIIASMFSEFLQYVLKHYGSALRYGNKYIYQCMPRLLSLWLDFGAKVTEEEGNYSSHFSHSIIMY